MKKQSNSFSENANVMARELQKNVPRVDDKILSISKTSKN